MIQVYIFWEACEEDQTRPVGSPQWESEHQLRLEYHCTDKEANALFSRIRPDVMVTVGASPKEFRVLAKMPRYIRKRWIHVGSVQEITVTMLETCFEKALEAQLRPEVSVFTSTYHSGDRILRPLQSLKAQTMKDWEWVMMDDSKESDEGKTWAHLQELAQQDCRIRVFRPPGNDGYIGSVKRNVSSMCRAPILVELDHDDELLPEALQLLVNIFKAHPEVGMVGSDCSEIYEKTLENFQYGPYFGLGHGSYYRQRYQNRWVNVARLGPLTRHTLRHIVGVPNHVRAWRASVYYSLGGHDENLNVADDYDLILRTFVQKGVRIARVPRFLYIQYRNEGGNNFTFHRNRLIQKLVGMLAKKYDEVIHERLIELGVTDFEKDPTSGLYRKGWCHPPNAWTSWKPEPIADLVLDPSPQTISIVMPTYNRPIELRRAVLSVLNQEHKDWKLYIIGDHCPVLDEMMEKEVIFHDHRIHYWNLPENTKEGGTTPRNYALRMLVTTEYVAYLDDDNYWLSDHLSSLWALMNASGSDESSKSASFVFSSFTSEVFQIICKEPIRYRIDTSCILHKRSLLEKYGYWRKQSEVGYAHDFEIVSRWVGGKEPWAASKKPTLWYQNSHQDMKAIYEAYPDQKIPPPN